MPTSVMRNTVVAENEAAAHHRWWAAALVSQLSGLPPNLADRLHDAHAVVHNHVGQRSTYALGTVSVSWSHAAMHGSSRFDGLRMEQSRLPRQRDRYCTAGQAPCATSHTLSAVSAIDKTESHPLAATHLRSWSPTCGHQPSSFQRTRDTNATPYNIYEHSGFIANIHTSWATRCDGASHVRKE